jgi:hypothetical protein
MEKKYLRNYLLLQQPPLQQSQVHWPLAQQSGVQVQVSAHWFGF